MDGRGAWHGGQGVFEHGADATSWRNNMTDQTIASRLKALAEDYERRGHKEAGPAESTVASGAFRKESGKGAVRSS